MFSNAQLRSHKQQLPRIRKLTKRGGEPESSTETDMSQSLRTLAAESGIATDADLLQLEEMVQNMNDQGFQSWLITYVLTEIGVDQGVAEGATDAIPVVGWINISATIVGYANKLPKLEKLRYIVNGAAAVSIFMMYRTYADEMHTGHLTSTEYGSMIGSLGQGDSSNTKDPEVGGTASAEGTPLYQNLIENQTTTQSDPHYLCNNGKPVPTGKLICPEESLAGKNSYLQIFGDILNVGGGIIPKLAQAWNSSVGWLLNIFGNAINDVLGSLFKAGESALLSSCKTSTPSNSAICQAYGAATKGMADLEQAVIGMVIPNPFSSNMSGGRTFDMMAAGADVSGNDYAHNGLGGKVLTPSQVADITNQQDQQAKQDLTRQSLFAQIFNTSSPYSLISKLAMETPISVRAAENSVASFLSNPFAPLIHNFSSILTGKVDASVPAQSDPFGVAQYGYTQSDIDQIGDSQTYWNQHCNSNAADGYQNGNTYNTAAQNTTDPNTETGE